MRVTFKDLSSVRDRHKKDKIVLVGGVFDLLHPGHIKFLERSKSLGDILVVAVSSDKRVRERKGLNRPIQRQADRLRVVDAIKYVDYTLIAPSAIVRGKYPTVRVVEALRPDIFVSRDPRWKKHLHFIKNAKTEFAFDPTKKQNSTTRLVRRTLRLGAEE